MRTTATSAMMAMGRRNVAAGVKVGTTDELIPLSPKHKRPVVH